MEIQLTFAIYFLNQLLLKNHVTQEFTADSADIYNLPVESAALEQSMCLRING
jgi:hypothetical protein